MVNLLRSDKITQPPYFLVSIRVEIILIDDAFLQLEFYLVISKDIKVFLTCLLLLFKNCKRNI